MTYFTECASPAEGGGGTTSKDEKSETSMTGDFWVRCGWLIDGTGNQALAPGFLRIARGRIASVGSGVLPSQKHTRELDLSDCTVLPALADCHVHLCLSGARSDRKGQKGFPQTLTGETDQRIARHLRLCLEAGIVAVREGGDPVSSTLRFRKERLRSESPIRLLSPGAAWHAPGRYGAILGKAVPPGRSLAECVSRNRDGADHVKIVQSGLNSLCRFGRETPPQFGTPELKAAVDTAHESGLPVMIHANGFLPVRSAVDAGCDSVEHGFFMGKENLERMAERGIYWVPTTCAMLALAQNAPPGSLESETARRTLDRQIEQIALARSIGLSIACGTDSGTPGVVHGASIWTELALLARAGFSIEEALRCATSHAAKLLGLEENLGILAAGMPATFLAVRAAPSNLFETAGRLGPTVLYVNGDEVPLPAPASVFLAEET